MLEQKRKPCLYNYIASVYVVIRTFPALDFWVASLTIDVVFPEPADAMISLETITNPYANVLFIYSG